MLFNEPKLLKLEGYIAEAVAWGSFSALQRAEIAEIHAQREQESQTYRGFSALQRAEIAEISPSRTMSFQRSTSFSALQRAEIAEIEMLVATHLPEPEVSVLFNEPKLLKSTATTRSSPSTGVSVLFNEPKLLK